MPFIRSAALEAPRGADAPSYAAMLPAILSLSLAFGTPVTFLIGENGTGKSTLLEAIAVKRGFNPEGGSRGVRFSTYESHSSFTGWEATASTSSTSRRLPSRRRGS